MPYILNVKKEPEHICTKPDLNWGTHGDPGSIWQCQCGLLWLMKSSIGGRHFWKEISHKKAAKIAGIPIPLIPQEG